MKCAVSDTGIDTFQRKITRWKHTQCEMDTFHTPIIEVELFETNLSETYAEWLNSLTNWRYFIGLTYRRDIGEDSARKDLVRLIKELNINAFGKNYTRKVGHSYFSYVISMEHQIRGTIHFHLLVDLPINATLLENLWNKWAGIAYIEPVETRVGVTRYMCKGINRGGGPDPPYIRDRTRLPEPLPSWWTV